MNEEAKTDAELDDLVSELLNDHPDYLTFRAAKTIQSLRARLTPEAKPEPVAWQLRDITTNRIGFTLDKHHADNCATRPHVWEVTPLYAHPAGSQAVEGLREAAMQETLRRYPDAASALVFFWIASGLSFAEPTDEVKAWAAALAAEAVRG